MSNVPEELEELAYRDPAGGAGEGTAAARVVSVAGEEEPAPPYLVAQRVQLADGSTARRLLVGPADRACGYRRLDNEILAGLRLRRLVGDNPHPSEVSRLIDYEADSAEPFALLKPYRGEPLATAARRLLPEEQHRFEVSLLRALCWLAAAGIAHRGLSPSTVRWDGTCVQITDFSLATVFEVPREVIGALPWAAPEQRRSRDGQAHGQVSGRDDVWAVGRLIYYVLTGEELTTVRQVAGVPGLDDLLQGVFGPPGGRPTASEMLTARLNQPSPVPRGQAATSSLDDGHTQFYLIRNRKHPGAPVPPHAAGFAARPPDGTAPAAARPPAAQPLNGGPPQGGRPPGRDLPDGPPKAQRRRWFPRAQASAFFLLALTCWWSR